jgi:transposase
VGRLSIRSRDHARANLVTKSRRKKIAEWLCVSLATVYNVRRRYVNNGLKSTLFDSERPGQPPKLSLRQQSQITVLACSKAPVGHAHWTFRLLADEAVHAKIVDSIAPETIRQFLKKQT